MPEVTIHIGGRGFEVSCQEGEESYLHSAAKMLDDEAQVLSDQIGRMPEARMLLMAGLMLADKTAGMEEQVRATTGQISALQAEIAQLKNTPAPEPEKVEVAVIPDSVTDSLAEIAARAESLAATVVEKARA